MLKTIPFNLQVNGKAVRTLDALRINFHIHDVLEYYHNGLLERWLEVRGHEDLARKLTEFRGDTPLQLAGNLVKLLGVTVPDGDIARDLHILRFEEDRQAELRRSEQAKQGRHEVLSQYHQGYTTLLQEMKDKSSDFPFLKAATQELHAQFSGLFELDFRRFYDEFNAKAPLAIFAVLMHKELRGMLLLDSVVNGHLQRFYRATEVLDKVKEQLLSWSGKTDSYWKVIQPAGREYLVISMENGNFLRDAGAAQTQLKADDVNGQYLLLKGIDYMSNNDSQKLLYMEV